MATRFSKPITRRIGDLIVTISETHIAVRRRRHKRGVRVALAELVAASDQVRPPRGWIPKTGEIVAVLPRRHRARVCSLIEAVGGLLVRIRFRKGAERIVELFELTPTENERIVVECERTPGSGTEKSDRTLF